MYAGQEATVRHVDLLADQGTWNNGLLQVVRTASSWKGVVEAVMLSPCLFNLYICRVHHANARLDETPAGIKVSRRKDR